MNKTITITLTQTTEGKDVTINLDSPDLGDLLGRDSEGSLMLQREAKDLAEAVGAVAFKAADDAITKIQEA